MRSLQYSQRAMVPSVLSPSVPLIKSVTRLTVLAGPRFFFQDQISMVCVCVLSEPVGTELIQLHADSLRVYKVSLLPACVAF